MNKNVLDVVIVVDGRPGHEKQSFGIVNALSTKVTVNTFVIDVSQRSFYSQLKSYVLLAFSHTPSDISLPEKADLVIGTGTRTHSTILSVKNHFSIPAITCMTPGKHLRNSFDLCFVPEHDGCLHRDNYFFTCGAPNICINKKQHRKDKGLILLGGIDVKSHVWNSEDIESKVSKIIAVEKDVHWTISSSPRTPEITVAGVKKIVNETDNAVFFDYKETPKGWVEEQYDQCSTVWVTTDSISMLYEALSSGCRVHVIPMLWKKSSSKFRTNEDILIEKSLVTSFASWEKGSKEKSVSSQLNEAQRCADHILQTCRIKN